ncbi:lppC lipofamily protein, partial [Vibrio parahaemolyticus V-223/04]
HWR